MKKCYLFLFLLLCSMECQAQMLQDSIGRYPVGFYPFFYNYDFPEYGVYHDSVLCSVKVASSGIGNRTDDKEYTTFMHTDDTISVTGIAIYVYNGDARLHLYDGDMNLLATGIAGRYDMDNCMNDSNYVGLYIPQWTNNALPDSGRWFKTVLFENHDVLKIIGDFYVGAQVFVNSSVGYSYMDVTCLKEDHIPPYHFPNRPARIKTDKEWKDTIDERAIPLIFPIIELPCECSVNVAATIGADGCLTASWDSLARQSQWVVQVEAQGTGLRIIDTVDTCHWQRCGLPPDNHYSVRVRSRCDNLRTYSWSAWSDAVTARSSSGIEDREERIAFTLSPNPASEAVTVTLTEPAEGCRLELYSVDGRQVAALDMASTTATLDLRGQPSGVYLLKILSPSGAAVRKLLVQ